jgi:hypothetical protein
LLEELVRGCDRFSKIEKQRPATRTKPRKGHREK